MKGTTPQYSFYNENSGLFCNRKILRNFSLQNWYNECMEIKNKIVIVTGASEGIGRATAIALSREGATVVLAARSDDKIAELAHELPGSLAVHTDMRNPADIQNLIDRTIAVHERIDILINNAGQGMHGPVEKIDIARYKEIMELNVYGPLIAMQAVIPFMRTHGGGMIVNVSSRVSKNYFPNLAAYASTKYALNALSLTAREELKPDNIVVSVMHPKMTATNFGKNSVTGGASRPARPGGFPAGNNPAMQVDTPEEVAETIIELIKSEAPEAEM
jgi:short-subunit dehydrogenase